MLIFAAVVMGVPEFEVIDGFRIVLCTEFERAQDVGRRPAGGNSHDDVVCCDFMCGQIACSLRAIVFRAFDGMR